VRGHFSSSDRSIWRPPSTAEMPPRATPSVIASATARRAPIVSATSVVEPALRRGAPVPQALLFVEVLGHSADAHSHAPTGRITTAPAVERRPQSTRIVQRQRRPTSKARLDDRVARQQTGCHRLEIRDLFRGGLHARPNRSSSFVSGAVRKVISILGRNGPHAAVHSPRSDPRPTGRHPSAR